MKEIVVTNIEEVRMTGARNTTANSVAEFLQTDVSSSDYETSL